MAAAFSLAAVAEVFGDEGVAKCEETALYIEARGLAKQVDPDIIRLGQQIRRSGHSLRGATVEVIRALYEHAPESVLLDLQRIAEVAED